MKLFREILIICLLGKLIACSPLASGEINDVWGHKQVLRLKWQALIAFGSATCLC